VADLRNAADLQRVIAALQSGDLQEAITAMHLDPAAFGDMQDAIARSYGAGGQSAASHMPGFTDAFGRAIVVRFDARNPRAEGWLSEHSSTLVTRILDDQRQGLRQALTAGMVQGQNPRTVALDIVGRIDRTTGQRSGGIIGLTSQQTEFAANARAELASE
jgi:hypothetical protein